MLAKLRNLFLLVSLVGRIKQLIGLFLDWLTPNRHKSTGLLAETEKALQDMKYAREALNYADDEMIDYAIHNINATEKRFIGLLKKAREAGIKAWELDAQQKNTYPGVG